MTFSDQTLSAYVDGELDAATRAALEAAMAGDPTLAGRIARQRALRGQDVLHPEAGEYGDRRGARLELHQHGVRVAGFDLPSATDNWPQTVRSSQAAPEHRQSQRASR